MEEQNEFETKKKGKGSTIVIVLLIIVIIGLLGFICYDKGIIFSNKEASVPSKNEQSENNIDSDKKEESVTFTDIELEKYVNNIKPLVSGPSQLIYDTTSVDSKNLSAADKIKYIGKLVYKSATTTQDFRYSVISENAVKQAVEEVYGPNTYERTKFNLGSCGDYILNENDNNYYSATGCGGTYSFFVGNAVIDYKATKSKLEITTAYAFIDGETMKVYKDYNKTMYLEDYNSVEEPETYLKNYAKNNKEKLNTIVYTFESTDGNHYYFTGLKNNK